MRASPELVTSILAGPPALGRTRLVAIDGPSGSGKSTFAARLAATLRPATAPVTTIHLDDLLDGWDDLPTMWPRVTTWLLDPIARGEPGRYQSYDWLNARFAPTWHEVPPGGVLILEGVSSARRAARPFLTAAVFVDAPADVRLARAVARDGEHLRPELLRWAAAEEEHFTTEGTRAYIEAHGTLITT
ncbi:(d)CMP kinase [Longispora albida]|uniref:(d)CMP kinase n=1 Tax=Longispora albida TaxID=203523 RepID=UPI00035D9AE0|nr:(d)CMP kinase [Longispora albida]